MTRPAMEVADIVRAKGREFLQRYQSTVSYQQLKAFRAIGRCRTAALGEFVQQCDHCSHQVVEYKSCLMGSVLFWGVAVR